MTWKILIETQEGVFEPTGKTYEGTPEAVNEHLETLRQQTSVCHGAELITTE
jgi:hypothetical protein